MGLIIDTSAACGFTVIVVVLVGIIDGAEHILQTARQPGDGVILEHRHVNIHGYHFLKNAADQT
jgi:hypothetical protein